MAVYVVQINKTMQTMKCGECGAVFAVAEEFYQECRDHGKSWYCPNGHCRHFCEPEVDRLRRRLAAQVAQNDQCRAKIRDLELSRSGLRGHLTRIKRRVSNGVCPCCRRHFVNLERHMRGMHPDFSDKDAAQQQKVAAEKRL